MTQAYNLSQLANNLTSSGLLDASDGLVNAVPIANGGTGATTASSARANLDVAQAVYSVPSGGIILWSGSQGAIPTGWYLCNGSNGTPDLRDKFIVGAGNSYAVGSTGGTKDAVVVAHTHTATSSVSDPGHSHYAATYYYDEGNPRNVFRASYQGNQMDGAYTAAAATGISVSTNVTSSGVSGTNQNLPPYYALCYIMKS